MLRVNYIKWNQTPQDLRDLSLYEQPPGTRERFLALYDIATGKNTTQVSSETGRNNKTVMGWVHKYLDSTNKCNSFLGTERVN